MLISWLFYSLTSIYFEICDTLNCYKCTANTENSSCIMEPMQQSIDHCNASFCQVWKLQSAVNNQVHMFERSCSITCITGCITLSDMANRFISCSSCCQTDGCNTDNRGKQLTGVESFLLHITMIFFYDIINDMFL